MLTVVEVLQRDEFQQDWLDQLSLELADFEAVVTLDVAVADAEQPLHHFLRSPALSDQHKLLSWTHKVGD